MTRLHKLIALLTLVIVVVFVALIVNFEGRQRLADSSVKEANKPILSETGERPQFVLRLDKKKASSFRLIVSYRNQPVSSLPDVASLFLNFDPKVVSVENVSLREGTFAATQQISNDIGQVNVDLASLENGFIGGDPLVTVDFRILDATTKSTVISVDPVSTLGYPDIISLKGAETIIISF